MQVGGGIIASRWRNYNGRIILRVVCENYILYGVIMRDLYWNYNAIYIGIIMRDLYWNYNASRLHNYNAGIIIRTEL